MGSHEAAWYPDPLGRFEVRYFDGNAWTAHVSSQGVTSEDPLEAAAATVPTQRTAAQPAAAAAKAAAQPSDVTRFRMGWVMVGAGLVGLLGTVLPWGESNIGDDLIGIETGPGQVSAVCSVLLALYGAQGVAGRRVRFHGGVVAVIAVSLLFELLALTVLDLADEATFDSGAAEPGYGLELSLLATLFSIWPLVMLWRDDRRRRTLRRGVRTV